MITTFGIRISTFNTGQELGIFIRGVFMVISKISLLKRRDLSKEEIRSTKNETDSSVYFKVTSPWSSTVITVLPEIMSLVCALPNSSAVMESHLETIIDLELQKKKQWLPLLTATFQATIRDYQSQQTSILFWATVLPIRVYEWCTTKPPTLIMQVNLRTCRQHCYSHFRLPGRPFPWTPL